VKAFTSTVVWPYKSKMKKFLINLAFLVITNIAHAEPQKLNGAEISALLSDKTIYSLPAAAPSEQIFQKAGSTFYSENGNQSQGEWNIQGDKYCSVWPPSQSWVCYDMTRDGNLVSFISPSGKISSYALSK
jgi:hypothetical protein